MSDEPADRVGSRTKLAMAIVGALIAAAILVPLMLFLGRDDGSTATDISGYLTEQVPLVEQRTE